MGGLKRSEKIEIIMTSHPLMGEEFCTSFDYMAKVDTYINDRLTVGSAVLFVYQRRFLIYSLPNMLPLSNRPPMPHGQCVLEYNNYTCAVQFVMSVNFLSVYKEVYNFSL